MIPAYTLLIFIGFMLGKRLEAQLIEKGII